MTAEYLIAVQEQKVSQVKVLEEECGEIQRLVLLILNLCKMVW